MSNSKKVLASLAHSRQVSLEITCVVESFRNCDISGDLPSFSTAPIPSEYLSATTDVCGGRTGETNWPLVLIAAQPCIVHALARPPENGPADLHRGGIAMARGAVQIRDARFGIDGE